MNGHLTWEQISDYLIGDAAPHQARHVRECAACHAEVVRLESALSEFRGAVRQWIGRWRRTDLRQSDAMHASAGAHLDRLLTPASLELPWYRSLLQSIALTIHPRQLPPLELTSKPVASGELKGLSGLYAGYETRAGFGSLAIHSAMVALMLFFGSLKPVQRAGKMVAKLVAPPVPLKVVANKGGGRGGARQAMVEKVAPPKPVRQFVPPPATMFQTQLSAPVSANAPDIDLSGVTTQSGLSAIVGAGPGGGFAGLGIGDGAGPGAGPGASGGAGDHRVYLPGAGATNPVAIYKPEPQYSEEARKAKWQGSVLLSLVVDENGHPMQIKVVRSLGLGLDEKAIQAVSQWRFTPGMKDGKPIAVAAQIEVTFRLL
jgi:TonB family protein